MKRIGYIYCYTGAGGRHAPKKIADRADFIIEVKDLKHPKEMVTTKGI